MGMDKQGGNRFKMRPLSLVYDVKHLISIHYFEFAKDYIFDGEKHNFWEFLYVDKGEVEVMANTTGYKLKQGDIIFHKPNEFHSVWANRKIASNVVVISFSCYSRAMSKFENNIFCLNNNERNLIANCVKNGMSTYYPPFDDPYRHDLVLRENAPLGSEQMLKIHLELLLLNLATRGHEMSRDIRLSSSAKERIEDEIVKRTIKYMQDHLREHVTLDQISNHLNISQTHLVTLFKEKVGMSVIRYYKTEKIEQAKILIREQNLNFTEISDLLSYSSIHTFSRHFKSVTDMTPSEYAKSVQARLPI